MMPFRDAISVDDAHAIHAYIISQAWEAYDAQEQKAKQPPSVSPAQ
jgi:hypothetical protein